MPFIGCRTRFAQVTPARNTYNALLAFDGRVFMPQWLASSPKRGAAAHTYTRNDRCRAKGGASICNMEGLSKDSVVWLTADENMHGQRIDNLLARVLKGVPRSHIYQLLRSGQVRVNSGRVDATYRLCVGDRVRLPPVRLARPAKRQGVGLAAPSRHLERAILYEDDHLLVLNKPSGLAVHGGSGISRGVIEELRVLRSKLRFLELVHRLDRETSGILLLAKKRAALVALHSHIRSGAMRKFYQLLVKGEWTRGRGEISLPLDRHLLAGGDRRVKVSATGQTARTVFEPIQSLGEFSLLEAELLTGRTHQIRVHAAHCGHPIVGDDKYGDFALNKAVARRGLNRMFLHAARVEVLHPANGALLRLSAPLAPELAEFLARIGNPDGA
jgi:23S rRNA pseudouridine955/2504/2580 synthase